MKAGWRPSIESIPVEVHLNVLRVHVGHHLREIRKDAIQVWHILHVKIDIRASVWNPPLSRRKLLVSTEVELKSLILTVL
jgi:hypothetical protein